MSKIKNVALRSIGLVFLLTMMFGLTVQAATHELQGPIIGAGVEVIDNYGNFQADFSEVVTFVAVDRRTGEVIELNELHILSSTHNIHVNDIPYIDILLHESGGLYSRYQLVPLASFDVWSPNFVGFEWPFSEEPIVVPEPVVTPEPVASIPEVSIPEQVGIFMVYPNGDFMMVDGAKFTLVDANDIVIESSYSRFGYVAFFEATSKDTTYLYVVFNYAEGLDTNTQRVPLRNFTPFDGNLTYDWVFLPARGVSVVDAPIVEEVPVITVPPVVEVPASVEPSVEFVTPEPVVTSEPGSGVRTATVTNATWLNVRRGAGINFTAFAAIPRGYTATIIGQRGSWLQLQTRYGIGWSYMGYLVIN